MPSTIESANTRQERKSKLRQLIWPGFSETFIYLVLALMVMSVVKLRPLWQTYNNSVVGKEVGLHISLKQFGSLHTITQSQAEGTLLQFVFWGLVGVFSYVAYWMLRNIIVEFYNDIIIGKRFMSKSHAAEKKYLGNMVVRKFLFVVSLVMLLFYLGQDTRWLIRISNVYYQSATNLHSLQSGLRILVATILSALLIYVFLLLVRITAISWLYLK